MGNKGIKSMKTNVNKPRSLRLNSQLQVTASSSDHGGDADYCCGNGFPRV